MAGPGTYDVHNGAPVLAALGSGGVAARRCRRRVGSCSLWRCRVGGVSFCRARGGRWLVGMVSLLPLGLPVGDKCLRPRASRSDQLAHLCPGTPWSQLADRILLDFLKAAVVALPVLRPRFARCTVALGRVCVGCNFGDFRLLGFGERICHEVRVEANTPLLNRVLTDPQRQVFNGVSKPRALHRPKPQQPLHRLHPTNENGPSRGTPLPGQGLTTRLL